MARDGTPRSARPAAPGRRRPGLGASSAKGGEHARSDFAIPTGRRAISTIVLLKRKQTPDRPRVPIARFSPSVSVRHTEWRHATGFVGPRKRKYRALERTNRTAHGIVALQGEDYTLDFRAFAASIVHPDVPNGRSRRTDSRMISSSTLVVAALTPSIQSVPRGAGACSNHSGACSGAESRRRLDHAHSSARPTAMDQERQGEPSLVLRLTVVLQGRAKLDDLVDHASFLRVVT
jgi:hypothetical protein